MLKTNLICNNFSGINRTSSVFSASVITASDIQNVELYSTGVNSGVGIRTAKGNASVFDRIPNDEKVIDIFESVQQGNTCFFVYTESENEGKIYLFDIQAKNLILKVSNLSVTGKASACDVSQGWSDLFVFSNGEEILSIELNKYTDGELDEVTMMNLTDTEGRSIKGLGIVVFAGRLWIFSNQTLWYSVQEDIYDFSTSDASISTSAGYIEFVKNITAIYPYLGTLAVFHSNSSSLITEDNGVFSKTMDSPGGCAGIDALVFHGTELYFYDDTKKGVYCFRQVVNGDKTLGENIALDIQEELCDIPLSLVQRIKTLSVVTSDRNEVWFLIPSNNEEFSIILIYDYLRKSWVKRKSQKINCMRIIGGVLYSAGKKIYEEYSSNNFDGVFIPSYYKCTPLNLGKENNMKVLNNPPGISLDMNYNNKFYIEYVKNYDSRTSKVRYIAAKTVKNSLYFDIGCWDVMYFHAKDINSVKKMPVSFFKTLQITFLTKTLGEDFCIKNIEFERIKVKAN